MLLPEDEKYLYIFDPHYVNTFTFIPNITPLSSFPSVLSIICLYFILIYLLKDYILKKRQGKAIDLTYLAIYYNLFLSILSAYLLYHLIAICYHYYQIYGLWTLLCDEKKELLKGPKTFLYISFI